MNCLTVHWLIYSPSYLHVIAPDNDENNDTIISSADSVFKHKISSYKINQFRVEYSFAEVLL